MNKDALLVVLTVTAVVVISSSVTATSSCRTGMPGDPGIVIPKFLARNGTTNNVILYLEDANLSLGDTLVIHAGKNMSTGDVFVIENLTVALYRGGALINKSVTNRNGRVSFLIASPGSYELTGGDANFSFQIGDINSTIVAGNRTRGLDTNGTGECDNNTALNGTVLNGTTLNGTALNGTALNGTGVNNTAQQHETGREQASTDSISDQQLIYPPAKPKSSGSGEQLILYIIVAVIVAVPIALFAIRHHNNKKHTGLRRKGLRW